MTSDSDCCPEDVWDVDVDITEWHHEDAPWSCTKVRGVNWNVVVQAGDGTCHVLDAVQHLHSLHCLWDLAQFIILFRGYAWRDILLWQVGQHTRIGDAQVLDAPRDVAR